MSWRDWLPRWSIECQSTGCCRTEDEVEQVEVVKHGPPGEEPLGRESSAELDNAGSIAEDRDFEALESDDRATDLLTQSRRLSRLSNRSESPLGVTGPVADCWRRQVCRNIKPGIARLIKGMGTLAAEFHRQRTFFTDPVVSFMFADGRVVDEKLGTVDEKSPSSQNGTEKSPNSEGAAEMSPSAMSQKSGNSKASQGSWWSWASGPTHHDELGPRSLRLRQRVGRELDIIPGSEQAYDADAPVTKDVIEPGEVEVLVTRRICTPACLSYWGDGEGIENANTKHTDSIKMTDQDVAKKIHQATDFGLAMQLPCNSWLFRAICEGLQQGPLYNFARRGVTGKEAMEGLGHVYPHTMAFLTELVIKPKCVLNISEASHDCVRISLNCPLDFESIAKLYPKVAQLLRITKSVRMRFYEGLSALKTSKQKKADKALKKQQKSDENEIHQNEALTFTYDEGAANITFLICGKFIAWQTPNGEPVIRDGKVALVSAPICPASNPGPARLSLYGYVDNMKLKLSEFGCLGMGSVALPDANIVVVMSSSPLSQPAKLDAYGSYACTRSVTSNLFTTPSKRESEVVSNVSFRILEMSAFPAEALVKPFFDIKLMRFLLISTLKANWNIRLHENGAWQLITNIQASVPRVARAFRMCFKHFASSQIRESDWLKLFANLFAALGNDLEQHEASLSAQSANDLVNQPDSTLEPPPSSDTVS